MEADPRPPTYQEDVQALYEAHKNMIYAYVSRRVRSEDVEDVLQEVMKAVVERFSSFLGQSTVRTWVYSICRFSVFKYYARMNRQPGGRGWQQEVPEPADGEPTPLESLIDTEKLAEVRHILTELRPIDREILTMRFVEELGFAEIAEILGLESDEACRSRCRRAIATVQKRFRHNPVFAKEG